MLVRLIRPLLLVPALAVWAIAFFSLAGQAASAAVICAVPKPLPVPAPHRVVGHGTAETCTQASLRTALTAGGYVTFDCGTKAVAIDVSPAIQVSSTTVIDGGGKHPR